MYPEGPALASPGNDSQLRVYRVSPGQIVPSSAPVAADPQTAGKAVEHRLAPGLVHLWLIPVSDARAAAARLWLAPDERTRADTFSVQAAGRQFIVARGFLRLLLARYLGMAPGDIAFGLGRNGKPHLVASDRPEVRFNVSHTDQAVALAFSIDIEIGVDIEQVRAGFVWAEVADLVLPPADCRKLARLGEAAARRDFFSRWVRMEAALKLTGEGLLHAMQHRSRMPGRASGAEGRLLQVDFDFGHDLTGSLAARPCRTAIPELAQ
jgi:4'-phosphopantetheinyl transferase